jgi:hypothetical protein
MDADVVWVTLGGYSSGNKVIRSSVDGHGTFRWENVSSSLPNVPATAIVAVPGEHNPVYLGSETGVYYRDDTVDDWIPFSEGLPVVKISDLAVDTSTGVLRAGTFGRGVWESPLYASE